MAFDQMNNFLIDVRSGSTAWRKWYLLGTQSVRSRYARSKLGQFWPSLSYLITVLSLGVVYSYLWKVSIAEFLPYLAISHVFWTLISGSMQEGTRAYIEFESLIKTEYHPRSMFVFVLMARQVTYFLHNAVVLIPLLIIFPHGVGWMAFLAIPGLVLVLLNASWLAMFIGFLCARYRDLPNVVSSAVQILFFVTPVMWQADRISDPLARRILTEFNPFASLIAVVRNPILGTMPSATQYCISIAFLFLGVLATVAVFNRADKRLVYWL